MSSLKSRAYRGIEPLSRRCNDREIERPPDHHLPTAGIGPMIQVDTAKPGGAANAPGTATEGDAPVTEQTLDPTQRIRSKRYAGVYYRLRKDGSRNYSVYWKGSFIAAGTTEDEALAKRAELKDGEAKNRRFVRPSKKPFSELASEYVERRRREVDARTTEHWEWALGHLLPVFGEEKLSKIGAEHVRRYMAAKQRERDEDGKRGLSNSSINKTLKVLAQILDEAIDEGCVVENVARGKRRRLKAGKPKRTWLEPEQAQALLEAAGKHRALLATMMLAGLRVGELTALRWRDVDLAGGKLRVTDSKTEAGVRVVDLSPMLLDELKLHKADSERTGADELVFGTINGTPRNRSNISRQILHPAIKRANVQLKKAGRAPTEGVTNHSLRRTFCALLYEAGATPAYVMAQMGHTEASLALEVYSKVMERKRDTGERMDALLRGADWESVEAPEEAELTNSA
jgi:integrase